MANGISVRVSKKRIRKRTARYAVAAEQSEPTRACPRTPSPSEPEQLRQLEDGGGADDRCREQEGEAGSVLVG